MYKNTLVVSAAALAIAQAFPAHGQTQAQMPEVVVTAVRGSAPSASVAGFSEAPLLQTPASVSVITREQMQDLDIRSTTDAARYDASISDAYNAVGYAEQFSIRGFKLDNARSYRKDGLAISGDTQIPLENKEAIQVLKGLAGLTAGVAAPGGIVDYTVKRPTNETLRSVLLEVRERGTVYGAVDLGGRFEDRRFGYRINVAGERLRSYIDGADGHRNFVSAAFDWQISPQALLQVDADYQKKSQVTAPGYQLINGVTLPNVAADTMLNDQPWSKPVETTSSNLGARFQYRFNADWQAVVSANRHEFRRDDYTAFPYGCSAQELYPGFCGNGDYDVYDYRSLGEKKKPLAARAVVTGRFATGTLTHELAAGIDYFGNKESWPDYVYEYVGVSNIYRPVAVAPSPLPDQPSFERRKDNERGAFVQDIVGLTDTVKLHAGARYAKVKRSELDVAPTNAGFWLPNVALVFSPNSDVAVYASYAQGLEHGGIAPIETTNENRALAPGKSKQVEVGAKAVVNGISLSAALFQIDKGLEYIDAANTYVRNGEARHRGVEFAAQGKATRDLTVGASLAALHTEQSGTGQSIYDGKRVTNVPALRSTVFAEYVLSPAWKVNGDWQFASKKAFDEENTVFVPKYHLLNFGGAYTARVNGMPLVVRAQVRNVLDKFYWRDVTPDLGGYLFPGAERTFRLSAQLDF
ncbi:iron complex outermembrane receptor protein [Pseudoduganella lurida]|uniref:Iron complex outermembrane receptor protein n=1 Tax=Pseudoduganella lurida TaxID=1036180 RepID=A0A562RDT5_9BURK|nr:TonB-dependent siderophore receptor [Pseudoduganella lurida]TWI66560.1 iron complex outermembrane receptor protein [Pseudoduganella lurida]